MNDPATFRFNVGMTTDLRTLDLNKSQTEPAHDADSEIREIRPADLEDLAQLYLVSYPPEIGAPDLFEAKAEIEATFAGEFGQLRTSANLIAFHQGTPAGAILTVTKSIWDPELSGPFIIDLFVSPRYRKQGIGRALVTSLISACKAADDTQISLRVGEGTSSSAYSLYSKLGFVEP